MTADRTAHALNPELTPDGRKRWLATLKQVFSGKTPWPWTSHGQRGDVRVAVCELGTDILAPRTARRFVVDVLRRWDMPDVRDDVELVVCELVANAINHGLRNTAHLTPIRLLMFGVSRSLLCMVLDPSSEPPRPRSLDRTAETGRGLQVVAGISERWGWSPLPTGKAVWASFTAPPPPESAVPPAVVRTQPVSAPAYGAPARPASMPPGGVRRTVSPARPGFTCAT